MSWAALGEAIKAERRKHRWRQIDLTHESGISKETIGLLENGKQPNVTDDTLIPIERSFGWLPGSCRNIVAGGGPFLPDDPMLAELNAAWTRLSDNNKAWILSEVRRLAQI